MTYQLTDHQKQVIDKNAATFWADLQVGILCDYDPETEKGWRESGHVFLFVNTWQGAMYFTDLGYFDNPAEVQAAIWQYDGYKNRPNVSARSIVTEQIRSVLGHDFNTSPASAPERKQSRFGYLSRLLGR